MAAQAEKAATGCGFVVLLVAAGVYATWKLGLELQVYCFVLLVLWLLCTAVTSTTSDGLPNGILKSLARTSGLALLGALPHLAFLVAFNAAGGRDIDYDRALAIAVNYETFVMTLRDWLAPLVNPPLAALALLLIFGLLFGAASGLSSAVPVVLAARRLLRLALIPLISAASLSVCAGLDAWNWSGDIDRRLAAVVRLDALQTVRETYALRLASEADVKARLARLAQDAVDSARRSCSEDLLGVCVRAMAADALTLENSTEHSKQTPRPVRPFRQKVAMMRAESTIVARRRPHLKAITAAAVDIIEAVMDDQFARTPLGHGDRYLLRAYFSELIDQFVSDTRTRILQKLDSQQFELSAGDSETMAATRERLAVLAEAKFDRVGNVAPGPFAPEPIREALRAEAKRPFWERVKRLGRNGRLRIP